MASTKRYDYEPNEALKALRKHTGLSQREFGARLDMPGSRIAHLERGAEPLGRITGLRIIDGYRRQMRRAKITLEELLRGFLLDWSQVSGGRKLR